MLGELILSPAWGGGKADRHDLLQTDTTFTFIVQITLKNLGAWSANRPPLIGPTKGERKEEGGLVSRHTELYIYASCIVFSRDSLRNRSFGAYTIKYTWLKMAIALWLVNVV